MPNVLQSRGSSSRIPHARQGRMMVNSSVLCVPPAQPLMPAASTMCSSLLFSLDVEEESHGGPAGKNSQQHRNTFQHCQYLCQPDLGSSQLVLDVRRLMRQLQSESADSSVDVVEMASRLSAMGYRVTVRTALGGGPACFRNLRHEFLTVLGEGDYKDVPYIVDPAFKEQFEIPSPSASYAALLQLLPTEFVGTSSRLVPLVQNLCAEMVASFEANSLTLPPWRRSQSMLTKWLPSRSRDVLISAGAAINADGSSGSAGAGSGLSNGNSPSGSPTGTDAAGGSPFSRIDVDQQLLCRHGSGKSLLSGKLCPAGSASTASSSSSSILSTGNRSAAASQASSAAASLQRPQQQLMQVQQQARQLSQQLGGGAISRQPSLYQGQPPTYTVKMGALAPNQQQ